ncbi:MAG: hypothetical protein M3160_00530 [Candidatus Eremiobacteraeota bacterium]|nr:hypothetical protein [Candidatus Eremiobacteraeota bacterium]
MEQLTDAAAIFFIFGAPVIVVAWIISRILAHRERMELMRMGMMPPVDQRNAQRYGSTSSAPPQSGASIPPVGMFEVENAQRSLHRGISLAFVGLALTIGLSFIGYHSSGGPLGAPVMVPGPWLLGGLIPMFVGIAQITIAILSGARISAPQPFGAPGARPKATPPPSGMPGPYAYRPGTTTELTRPVPPPDIKN